MHVLWSESEWTSQLALTLTAAAAQFQGAVWEIIVIWYGYGSGSVGCLMIKWPEAEAEAWRTEVLKNRGVHSNSNSRMDACDQLDIDRQYWLWKPQINILYRILTWSWYDDDNDTATAIGQQSRRCGGEKKGRLLLLVRELGFRIPWLFGSWEIASKTDHVAESGHSYIYCDQRQLRKWVPETRR